MAETNYFAEKKKICRLLAVAMAEDELVNDKELMAIVAVLLYKYYYDEIKDIEEYVRAFGVEVDEDLFEMTGITEFNYTIGGKHVLNEELEKLLFHLLRNQIKETSNKDELLPSDINGDKLCNLLLYLLINEDKRNAEEDSMLKELLEECDLEMSYPTEKLVAYAEETLKPICRIFLRVCLSCELVVRKCLDELKDEGSSTARSIFMNIDSLGAETIKKELKEMVYVIKSDESVLDREREAFRIICKIFRVKRSTELWRELNEWDRFDLLTNKDYSVKRKSLNVNDYSNIMQVISLFEIKGILVDGVYHVLLRNKMRKEEMLYRQDRKMSGWAIGLFAMSALLLYFYVVDLLHQPIEHHIVFNLDLLKSSIGEFIGYVANCKAFNWVGSGSVGLFVICLIVRFVYLKSRCKNSRNAYSLKLERFKGIVGKVFFIGVIAIMLYVLFFVVYKSPYDIFLETFFIPTTLMLMMLSIEWLIFMRQEYSSLSKDSKDINIGNNDANTTVLIVLVFAAILTDMCLGVVELVGEGTSLLSEQLVGKLASALILGCICFFAGKFLDMHRMQQQTDIVKMGNCIKELEGRLKNQMENSKE